MRGLSGSSPPRGEATFARQLAPVFSAFVLILLASLALSLVALELLSTTRSYVAGEGLWSKNQRDAVYYLDLYSHTRDPAYHSRFREALKVPLGDRQARLELEKPQYDYATAYAGFLQGGNHPDDIPGMIRLFRCCAHLTYLAQAIAIWREGDEHIAQLVRLGETLHREVASGTATRRRIEAITTQVRAVDAAVRPVEEAFTATLGEASRWLKIALAGIVLGAGLAMTALGLRISSRVLVRVRRAEEEIRNMARFPEQSPHPVLRARRDGTLIYGNKTSEPLRDGLGIRTGEPLPPEWMTVFTDAVKAQSSRTFEVACDDRHFMFVAWPVADADYVNFYGMDITEREQAKTALRASEERYRMLMEDAADAIFIADAKGNYLSVNAKACELLGYSREELLRLNIRDLIPPGDPPPRYSELRDGRPLLVERRLRCKNGSCVQTEISAKALPNGHLQAIVRDITARQQAEQALRDREAQYRAVIETTADGFWIVDMEGRLREVNDAYVRRSGYTREELLGMRVTDLEARETPEETAAHIAKVMRDGSDLFESWHRAKDGSLWPVEINVSHWPAAGGRLFVFLRDLSARRAVKAQMQKLSRALDQTADAVMVTDRQGVIEYVNPALEAMTGYLRAELIGRKPNVFRSGIQDEAFYHRMWGAILAGEIFSDVLMNRRKDGSLYYEEKLISPIKDGEGNITHFVATARDITERMAAQVRLAHLAHHDTLTELPNRTLFLDRLTQAMARAQRHGHTFAVLFLDLDDFKRINDVHGHKVGDCFLQGVAARLRTAVRASDTVARFGGDEFAFLVDDLAQVGDVAVVVDKIQAAFAAPIALAEGEFLIGASVGVSFYPDDGADADTLLKHADAAMYRAKDLREGGVRFHPPLRRPALASERAARGEGEGKEQ